MAEFDLSTSEGRRAYARKHLRNPDFCVGVQADCYLKGLGDGLPTNPRLRSVYLANAAKIGISPAGKRYVPELANKPAGLDPEAWVPSTEGRSYIKNLIRKRRWSCEGRVEVGAPSYKTRDEKKLYQPADDIVERAVTKELAQAGAKLSAKERRELKEKTAKTLAGAYAEDKL